MKQYFTLFLNIFILLELNLLESISAKVNKERKNQNLYEKYEKEENIEIKLEQLNYEEKQKERLKLKTSSFNFDNKKEFLKNKVMAHRGLFGYLPEHTKKGYELSYFMGADFMETDIGLTKDGKMIVFHDPILDDATNIVEFPEFANRRSSKTVDDKLYKNKFFITDFTYKEIQKLNTKQRHSNRPQIYNKEFKVLLIENVIDMVLDFNKKYNKTIGVYIEPKNNALIKKELNKDLNKELLNLLQKYNLTNFYDKEFKKCPIVIQSFDIPTLKFFKENADLPHIYLIGWGSFINMKESVNFTDGLGPNINYVLYERVDDFLMANGTKYKTTEEFEKNVVKKNFKDPIEKLGNIIKEKKNNIFVDYVHSLDLIVAPYDINNDNPKFDNSPEYELCKMKMFKVDSFFSDFCDTAIFSTKNSLGLCS
jgi:glycerophosphoryl diester phosphodiesterase